MKKHRYYAVTGIDKSSNNSFTAIVEAPTPSKAKTQFIKGHTIPYFEGWDNSEWTYPELRARLLKSISLCEPNDSFRILKTLILDDGWSFSSVDDESETINKSNFSNSRLKRYLEIGSLE